MKRTDDDPYLDLSWMNYRSYVWAKRFAVVMVLALCVGTVWTHSLITFTGAVFWAYVYDRWNKALHKAWAEYVWERDYMLHLRRGL